MGRREGMGIFRFQAFVSLFFIRCCITQLTATATETVTDVDKDYADDRPSLSISRVFHTSYKNSDTVPRRTIEVIELRTKR